MDVVEVFATGTGDFGCETRGCRYGLEACTCRAHGLMLAKVIR